MTEDRFVVLSGCVVDKKTGRSYSPRQCMEVMFPQLGADEMPASLRPIDPEKDFARSVRQRFGNDQEGTSLDSDDMIFLVRLGLRGLDPGERAAFVGKLSALLTDNSLGAADARRRFGARGRRPAQDSATAELNNKDFLRRHPYLKDVRLTGSWSV